MAYACQLNRQCAHQLEQLRITEYSRSDDFDLMEQDKLCWDRVDDSSIVLGVCNGEDIRSTMRGTVATSFEETAELVECHIPQEFFCGPTLVLSRAATALESRGHGYSSILRYHFINACIESPIRTIVGALNSSARRIEFMKAMGYEFSEPEPFDPGFIRLHKTSRSVVACLRQENFAAAAERLRDGIGDPFDRVPWQGDPLKLG